MNNKKVNPNHPQKGDSIKVEPIRNLKDIQSISQALLHNPRNHLLFVMGINNSLRVSDLLQLKVRQVRNMKPGDTMIVIESKTGKENILTVNQTVYQSQKNYFKKIELSDDDYIFKSRKGNGPLTIQTVNNLVKNWTTNIQLRGNYGAHTLRKTFGYIQRIEFGVGFDILAKRYNHASPSVTKRYLGIEEKEINGILKNEIG